MIFFIDRRKEIFYKDKSVLKNIKWEWYLGCKQSTYHLAVSNYVLNNKCLFNINLGVTIQRKHTFFGYGQWLEAFSSFDHVGQFEVLCKMDVIWYKQAIRAARIPNSGLYTSERVIICVDAPQNVRSSEGVPQNAPNFTSRLHPG